MMMSFASYIDAPLITRSRDTSIQHLLAQVLKEWYQMLADAVVSSRQRTFLVASSDCDWTTVVVLIYLQGQVFELSNLDQVSDPLERLKFRGNFDVDGE